MFLLSFACLFRLVVPRRGRMAIRGRDITKRSCRERESMTCTPTCTRTSAYACACTYEYSHIQPPWRCWPETGDWQRHASHLWVAWLRVCSGLRTPRMSNSH
ncbi:hypothetical protein CI102_8832 [Trichoderma harzianum]|nr:hypothetical protein CI102_8832 [Trichoderma harzianum]